MGALCNSPKVSVFTRVIKDIFDNYKKPFQCLHLEMPTSLFLTAHWLEFVIGQLPAIRLGDVENQ